MSHLQGYIRRCFSQHDGHIVGLELEHLIDIDQLKLD